MSNKIIRFCFVGCIIFSMVYFQYLSPPNERLKKRYIRKSYDGEIMDMYRDRSDHNSKVLIFDDGERILFPRVSYDLFDSIKIGDYIYKEQGTLEAFVTSSTGARLRIPYVQE
jgi:hypothetical protein